jgi:hypothetical protein
MAFSSPLVPAPSLPIKKKAFLKLQPEPGMMALSRKILPTFLKLVVIIVK